MIGLLPNSLWVGGVEHEINSDFRYGIAILNELNNPDSSDTEKAGFMLQVLYGKQKLAGMADYNEAYTQALWFLQCGRKSGGDRDDSLDTMIFDWAQDEHLIFTGIAGSIGRDVRILDYCHFWEFMSYFAGMGECTFTTVCAIRSKRAKGHKLEKWEEEFYRKNRGIIDLELDKRRKEDLFNEFFGVG